MATLREIEEAVRLSATKREAGQRLRITASNINCRLAAARSQQYERWRLLPPDGAYSRARDRSPPAPSSQQGEWDALVAEATVDHPLDPGESQRWNVGRLLWSLYAITGTTCWSRGWVRACMAALGAAGIKVPSAHELRWYRSTLTAQPDTFARSCPDRDLLRDMVRRSSR
jgi:hypothetical protein